MGINHKKNHQDSLIYFKVIPHFVFQRHIKKPKLGHLVGTLPHGQVTKFLYKFFLKRPLLANLEKEKNKDQTLLLESLFYSKLMTR
jgi:hypothetical protein